MLQRTFCSTARLLNSSVPYLTKSCIQSFDSKSRLEADGTTPFDSENPTPSSWNYRTFYNLGFGRNFEVISPNDLFSGDAFEEFKSGVDNSKLMHCMKEATRCYRLQQIFNQRGCNNESSFQRYFERTLEFGGLTIDNGFEINTAASSASFAYPKLKIMRKQGSIGVHADALLPVQELLSEECRRRLEIEMQYDAAPCSILVDERFLFNADVKPDLKSKKESLRRIGQITAYNAYLAHLMVSFSPNKEDAMTALSNLVIPTVLIEANQVSFLEIQFTLEWLNALINDNFVDVLPEQYPNILLYCDAIDKGQNDDDLAMIKGYDGRTAEGMLKIGFLINEKILKIKTSRGYDEYLKFMPKEEDLILQTENTQQKLEKGKFNVKL